MKKQLLILIFFLGALSLACRTLVPDFTTVDSGEVLFTDDFSDTSSGWDRVTHQDYIVDYAMDAYRIFVNSSHTSTWSTPGLNFGDAIIEVEALMFAGPDDNSFGVICRSDEDRINFYYFLISSDGYYTIGKVKEGEQVLLEDDVMQPSDDIIKNQQVNNIRADCVGDILSLFVNDKLLTAVQDADFQSGDVGLIAGSFDRAGVDIYFDNFVVRNP